MILNNQNLILKFDKNHGRIQSLYDGKREFVGEEIPIFEVALRDKFGEQIRVTSEEMNLTRADEKQNSFECLYELDILQIKIICNIDEFLNFGIQIKTVDEYVCEWVNYPQIVVPDDLSDNGGLSKILWGFNEGVLVDNLKYRESVFNYVEPEYPSMGIMGMYPGIVETQFMSYITEGKNLYIASHDKNDYLKGIDFYRYGDGIKLQFRHYCGVDFGQDYVMEYPMVIKLFDGDWYDATEIYRTWFEENNDGFIPINENSKLPEWYGESPVVITYPVRGLHDTDIMNPNKMYPYINAMPHIERLEKELGSKIMVILMHWEGTAPWAPPYVWPPFGGEDELKKFIDALHERGDILGVYCSGLGWTEQSNLIDSYNKKEQFDKENLRDVMCLSPKQELPYSKICTDQRVGYDLCPTQEFAVNTLKNEVQKMVSSGIDYIQLMDQNHGGTSYFCYSKNHGHPPVPGKWQVDAVKKLLAEVTKDTGKVLFGCESAAGQSYIPQLLFSDNRFELNYGVGTHVPVYSYVFHEYLNNFMGNQVCAQYLVDHKKSPENVVERLAYSFMAGDMMTLVLDQNGDINWNWGQLDMESVPEQEPIKTFVRNANAWRQGIGKKYLHTGKMVKPYKVNCGKQIIHFIKGKNGDYDEVYTSAWMSVDGGFAQFLINYNNRTVECEVELPEGEFILHEDSNDSQRISGGNYRAELKPLSIVMIENIKQG